MDLFEGELSVLVLCLRAMAFFVTVSCSVTREFLVGEGCLFVVSRGVGFKDSEMA
jgi:hypothetical protein